MADIKYIHGNPIVVGTSGIEDASVTLAKLASDVELEPPDGSITTAKLADGAVTDAKLAQSGGILDFVDELNANTVDMFLYPMRELPSYQGLTFTTDNDGYYAISGVLTASTQIRVSDESFVPVVGKTYKLTIDYKRHSDADHAYVFAIGENGSATWHMNTFIFTATSANPISITFTTDAVGNNLDIAVKITVTGYKLTNSDLRNDIDAMSDELSGYQTLVSTVDAIADAAPTRNNIITLISGNNGIEWDTGKFYRNNGGYLEKISYTGLSCARFGQVYAGEVYYVINHDIGTGYSIWLTDDENRIITHSTGNSTGYYDDAEFIVPQNAIMYLDVDNGYLTNGRYRLKKLQVSYDFSGASPLKDVKWCCFGDSLVEFNSTAENNWVKHMIAATGAINTNIATSGTGFYRGVADEDHPTGSNYASKLSQIPSDVELITVCGSFNDLMTSPWPSLPVGTASDTGTSTLAGYMNDFFSALIAAYPTVPIAVMTTAPWDRYKPGVTVSDEYVNVLKEICQKNGIPFIDDCYRGCNLKPWIAANKTAYYTHPNKSVDGVHPNSEGHVFIYKMLRPFLEKCVHKV